MPATQVRGAGLEQHQTVATDRGVQWAGREFEWPDGRVSKSSGGASDHGRDIARLPFERLTARLPCSLGSLKTPW